LDKKNRLKPEKLAAPPPAATKKTPFSPRLHLAKNSPSPE
jgi:hypothetical protein